MEYEYLRDDFLKLGYTIKEGPNISSHRGVFRVESLKYKTDFLCEIFGDKNSEVDDKLIEQYENIIKILSQASNSCVIQLYQYFKIENQRFLIYEDCSNLSLKSYLKNNKKVEKPLLTSLTIKIAKGMEYLHSLGISHCNLSASNIMLDLYYHPKITGFGKAKIHVHKCTCQSFNINCYSAPEIKEGQSFNPFKADVFAFGVLVYLMSTGTYPYNTNNPQQNWTEKVGEIFVIPAFVPKTICEIIKYCLKANPEERPSFIKILNRLNKKQSDLPPLKASIRNKDVRITGSRSLDLTRAMPKITPYRSLYNARKY